MSSRVPQIVSSSFN